MAKIRAHNEGSIYQRSNGTWRAQVSIDGRRLSFTAKTKKEGLAWILETKNQIDKGLTFEGAGMTLQEFLAEWLETVSISRSKGTHTTYSWTVKKRILPYIGNVNLMDLRPDRLQRFYTSLAERGFKQPCRSCHPQDTSGCHESRCKTWIDRQKSLFGNNAAKTRAIRNEFL